MYTLFGQAGDGSAIVEALFALTDLPHRVEEVDYTAPGPGRDRLLQLNPLVQVPALLLPDGSVMTESAAMALHLAERAPAAGLAPAPDDPMRPSFLRWLIFLVANVYPTFTYGDDPSRFISGAAPEAELRTRTDEYRQRLWRIVEDAITPAPWFLGSRLSALDPYVAVMTLWRPRRAWFAEHCPKLHAVALAADQHPKLAPVWRRNFS